MNLQAYIDNIDNVPLLSREEEVKLSTVIQGKSEGWEKALEKLITSNLLLVVSFANKFKSNKKDELIAVGNIGLMKAANKFIAKDARFASYASFWIRQAMFEFLYNDSVVRIPVERGIKQDKVAEAIIKLWNELDREPTVAEISRETGFGARQVKINMSNKLEVISMDSELEDGTNLHSFLAEEEAKPCDDALTLLELVDTLPDKYRDIIKMRFGIGCKRMLQREVGEVFDVSNRYICKLEEEAMDMLKTKYILSTLVNKKEPVNIKEYIDNPVKYEYVEPVVKAAVPPKTAKPKPLNTKTARARRVLKPSKVKSIRYKHRPRYKSEHSFTAEQLDRLTPLQRTVINHSFGKDWLTQEKIAALIGKTREGVQYIKNEALIRMGVNVKSRKGIRK